jgi:hypothetical protein
MDKRFPSPGPGQVENCSKTRLAQEKLDRRNELKGFLAGTGPGPKDVKGKAVSALSSVRLATLMKGAAALASPLAAMGEVAYADTGVKRRAEDDSNTVIECIMSGRLGVRLAAMARDRAAAAAAAAAGKASKVAADGGEFKADGSAAAGVGGGGSEDPADDDIVEVLASFLAPPPLPAPASAHQTATPQPPPPPPPPFQEEPLLRPALLGNSAAGAAAAAGTGLVGDSRPGSMSSGRSLPVRSLSSDTDGNRAIDDYGAALRYYRRAGPNLHALPETSLKVSLP